MDVDTTPAGDRIVAEPKAAQALTDLTLLPLLAHFLRHEASTREAADHLGADLDATYYQVRKLERLGILEVARTEARAGRPIKRYRASARAFFVPFAALPHETLARALDESARLPRRARAEGTAHALLEHIDDPRRWGFRIHLDDDDAVSAFWGPLDASGPASVLDALLEPDAPPVYGVHTTLTLTRDDAKALQRELRDLTERWVARSRATRRDGADGPTRAVLFGVGLAPEPPG